MRLAAMSYGIAGAVGLIVSGLYIAATHLPLGLPELLGGGWTFGVILAVSVMTWCVFSLQDAVLTGIRQAVWLPLENGIYGVAKIGLLIALASVAVQYGIVASWIVPAILIVVPVNLFIFCVLLPRHARSSHAEPGGQSARSIARFVGGDYLGSVLALATVDLLPLLVVARLGAVDTGYFSIPFLIIYSLDLVTVNLGVALTVEGAMDRSELRRQCDNGRAPDGAARPARGRRAARRSGPGAVALRAELRRQQLHTSSPARRRRRRKSRDDAVLQPGAGRAQGQPDRGDRGRAVGPAARIRLVADGRVRPGRNRDRLSGDAVRRRGGARSRHRAHHPGSGAEFASAV